MPMSDRETPAGRSAGSPATTHHQCGRRATRNEARERRPGRRDQPIPSPCPARRRGGGPVRRRGLADPPQLARQIARILPALVGVLREASRDDVVERGRRRRLQLGHRARLVLENRGDEAGVRDAGEGAPSRDHLVEDQTEGEDVGARIRIPAFDLFRRHVLDGPEDRAVRGETDGRRRRQRLQTVRRDRRARLRQSEVEQLGARLREHDVAGLQIPVHDAGAMCPVERRRDLDRRGQGLADGSGPFASRSARVSPSRYCMTRNAVPACSPTS